MILLYYYISFFKYSH